jgi:hypothetical protein
LPRNHALSALTLLAWLLSSAASATVVDRGRAQCCSSIAPEKPPATYYGATMFRDERPLPLGLDGFALPSDPPGSVEEMLARVSAAELRGGAMAPELVPSLQGLAAAYIDKGRVREAMEALRRGIHVARLNNGLYAPQQVPILQQLIALLVAQGDYIEADAQQAYLYRVLSWRNDHTAPELRRATLRYADWMRGAYLGDIDRERFPRLVGLNDLYERAMEDIEADEGPGSRALLPFLDGRIELSYLISVYPGEQDASFRGSAAGPGNFEIADQDRLRFWRMRDHNFRYGRLALEKKLAIVEGHPDSAAQDIAAAHLDLADWYQWHRRYAQAIRLYEECWDIMDEVDGGDGWLQRQFASPLELPRRSVFNPGAIPLGTLNDGQVDLAFTVSRHGEAKDIDILTKAEDKHGQAVNTRAYHYLRNLRFRPRLENGEVVDAENIRRTYQIRF